jgi:predicted nuclease with TOPRIM domain
MERFLQKFKSDLAANNNNIDAISVLKDYSHAVLEDYSDILKICEKLKSNLEESQGETSKSTQQLEPQATENSQINEISQLRRELATALKSNDELRKELNELRSQFEIVSSRLDNQERSRLSNQNRSLRSRFEALGITFGPTINLDAATDEEP